MEAIIEYLKKTYVVTKEDLMLPDDERNYLLGQLTMIEIIVDLYEKGIPNNG